MKNDSMKAAAFKAAVPYTLPILAGFAFLGLTYGLYMHQQGFSFLWPMLMSATIFAGSMEFIAANLLLQNFNPFYAFALTLMINARHLFYGVSMLDKFRGAGKKKWYLIFGMCDETFSINAAVTVPAGVDKGWFMFFVTLLNQSYWVVSATLGGLLGDLLQIQIKGVEFAMCALFVVIFTDRWISDTNRIPGVLGILCSTVCLIALGPENFIIPAMLLILLVLAVLKNRLTKGGRPS